MESFITYNGLALSSGGKGQLQSSSSKKIYQDIYLFLDHFTDCKQPESVQVVMHQFSPGSFLKYCLHFGIPRFDWWNFWSFKKDLVYWNAWPSRLQHTFPMVMADENLLLCVKWEFLFSDPLAGKVLPNQSKLPILDERKPKSSIYLRISEKRKTLSSWFVLPFAELDEKNIDYLRSIQAVLPFKFAAKGWRSYSKTPKGNWVPKKLLLQFQEKPLSHEEPSLWK